MERKLKQLLELKKDKKYHYPTYFIISIKYNYKIQQQLTVSSLSIKF